MPAVGLLLSALGCAMPLFERVALADDGRDLGFVSAEVFAQQYSYAPLQLQGSNVSRRLVGIWSPSSWPTAAGFGIDGDLHVAWESGWGLRLRALGLRFSSSGGQSSTAVAGESAISVRNGPLNLLELDIPILGGLGLQLVRGTFKSSLELTWGWAYAWSAATMTPVGPPAGQSPGVGTMTNDSIYVRAELDGCVRLGKVNPALPSDVSWVCLAVSPAVYEFGFLSGGSLGLRVDL